MKLLIEALSKYIIGVLLVGLLLFIPGGLYYWQGWLLMGVLFIPMFIIGIILLVKNPELLKKRLNNKEKIEEQKTIVLYSGLRFIVGFVISGLNYRFEWILMPNIVIWSSAFLFLLAYLLYVIVLKENQFLSRTIEVEEKQKVIDTGLYGIVRHPMYTSTIILFLTMPLILGSLISFLIFFVYPLLIILRIKNEEEILERDLKGYKEYKNKVKYRLIPYFW